MQLATVLTRRKPVRRNRYGERPEGLPGSESVACSERSIRNLGDPSTFSSFRGRIDQPKGDYPTGQCSEGSQIINSTLRR